MLLLLLLLLLDEFFFLVDDLLSLLDDQMTFLDFFVDFDSLLLILLVNGRQFSCSSLVSVHLILLLVFPDVLGQLLNLNILQLQLLLNLIERIEGEDKKENEDSPPKNNPIDTQEAIDEAQKQGTSQQNQPAGQN